MTAPICHVTGQLCVPSGRMEQMGTLRGLWESHGSRSTNIFARIKQDHDNAREIIAQLKASTPRAVMTALQPMDVKAEMGKA